MFFLVIGIGIQNEFKKWTREKIFDLVLLIYNILKIRIVFGIEN